MRKAIDILLIEPDSRHAALIAEAISKTCPRCHLERVAGFEEAKPLIRTKSPHRGANGNLNPSLIILELLDPKMPKAAEFLRWLREHPRTRHLPVIVLGKQEDAFTVAKAYDLGASSYLVKPKDDKAFMDLITTAATYWTALNHPPE